MKSLSTALGMAACLVAGTALAKDPAPEPVPTATAMGAVVVPVQPPAAAPAPQLRDTLREPLQRTADSEPYRMSEDERRKMREWLRSQAKETPLK